jgi:hypothetical protein
MRWWDRGRRRQAGHKSQRPVSRDDKPRLARKRRFDRVLKRMGIPRKRRR